MSAASETVGILAGAFYLILWKWPKPENPFPREITIYTLYMKRTVSDS
jgi:hypothetical protein